MRVVYGSYAWLALLIAVLPVAVGLAVAPGTLRRRRIARWGARLFFALIGSPVRVSGAAVPTGEACVVVANHASYLDGIVLTATLPPRFTFLIKQEMARVPLAGFVLRRLGSEFVDRENSAHRSRMARRLLDAALKGTALAFFPEGTFDGTPGLKPFQAGAFRAAWRAGLAVVPTVITGTRRKFPSGRLFAAPGPLTVHICDPLPARRFDSAQALLDAARGAMSAELGESEQARKDEETVPAATSPCSSDRPRPQAAPNRCSDTDP